MPEFSNDSDRDVRHPIVIDKHYYMEFTVDPYDRGEETRRTGYFILYPIAERSDVFRVVLNIYRDPGENNDIEKEFLVEVDVPFIIGLKSGRLNPHFKIKSNTYTERIETNGSAYSLMYIGLKE